MNHLSRDLRRIASWVIRDKVTKQAVCELFNPELVLKINTLKYEAVPILEYLQEINRLQRDGNCATTVACNQ